MDQADIKLRLYRIILIFGAVLAIISIIGNRISSFPLYLDFKWMTLFMVTVVAYISSKNHWHIERVTLLVFLFLICIFLPFAFVDSGGSNNNATGYTFLLLIAVTYLFSSWKRIFLISTLITVFMAMHAVEYYFPQLITVHSEWKQFVDRMIQMPLLLFASFLIILRFANGYEEVNRKLDAYANLDELTGLYNRRMFNKAIEKSIKRSNKPIQLVLMDIDNFKKVNDSYGHYVGDELLKYLSDTLREIIDFDKHIISRWGGDEFAVIYYGEKEDLIYKLEKVKYKFHNHAAIYEKTIGVSASIVSPREYNIVSQTLIAADIELYKEKLKKSSGNY